MANMLWPCYDLEEYQCREHGVREDLNRPNRGDEIDKYLPREVVVASAKPGPQWCCYFVSWMLKGVFGKHLLGQPEVRGDDGSHL